MLSTTSLDSQNPQNIYWTLSSNVKREVSELGCFKPLSELNIDTVKDDLKSFKINSVFLLTNGNREGLYQLITTKNG